MQTSPFLGLFYLGRLDFTASALASMGWRRGPSACQADTPCGRRRRLRATEPYARNRTEREESNRRSTLSVTVARLLPLLGMAVGATATPLHAPEPPEPACPTQKFAPLDILEQILRDRKARIRPTERRAGMDCAERLRVWHEVERLFNANDPVSPESRGALARTITRKQPRSADGGGSFVLLMKEHTFQNGNTQQNIASRTKCSRGIRQLTQRSARPCTAYS